MNNLDDIYKGIWISELRDFERASLGVGGLIHKKVSMPRPFNFLQVFCFIYTFLNFSSSLFFIISKYV